MTTKTPTKSPPKTQKRRGARPASSTRWRSRAVVRTVEPGTTAVCARCGEPVKFAARAQHRQVIANVYVKGVWNRVEHFHEECYGEAADPYGSPAA